MSVKNIVIKTKRLCLFEPPQVVQTDTEKDFMRKWVLKRIKIIFS